jgi:hypothetical protein
MSNETEWTVEQAVDNVEDDESIIYGAKMMHSMLNKWVNNYGNVNALQLVYVCNDTGELLVDTVYCARFFEGNDDRSIAGALDIYGHNTELHTCLGEL